MKVTVEFDNGATLIYHGSEAEDTALEFLNLDPDDYEPGSVTEIGTTPVNTDHPPFLAPEADDPKEDGDADTN